MKKLFILFVLILVAVPHMIHAEMNKPKQSESFKAGGVPISIPPPTTQFVEAGIDNRKLMEVFVAPNNRLLCAFVLANDLPRLSKGGDDFVISKYAMAQVPRRGENMDCEASDFKKVTDGAKATFGDVVTSSVKEAEEEFNRRMKSLNLDEAKVSIGQPTLLGCLFSKPDMYGFGMITAVSMGGHTTKLGGGAALIRVKKRLLFLYLYAEYKNEDTIKWLRKTTEEWSDAVLKSNK
jgi:hypothetical protein